MTEKHRDYIRSLPCCCCGNNIETQCAHVRFADPRAAKPITGMGRKPGDEWTTSLCNRHHAEQHDGGDERAFWKRQGIDPVFLALALWHVSGDYEAGCQIVAHARERL